MNVFRNAGGVGFEVISIATSQTSGVPPQSAIWIQSNPCCFEMRLLLSAPL